jgi:hypothetical protein
MIPTDYAAKFKQVLADTRRESEREAARITVEREESAVHAICPCGYKMPCATRVPITFCSQSGDVGIRGSDRWLEVMDEERGPDDDSDDRGEE